MSIIELFLIALGLSMDCFAVAISFGAINQLTRNEATRMAVSFGLFQCLMPLIGWLIGDIFNKTIESVDHWVAFGILAFIGFKMILQTFHKEHPRNVLDIRKNSMLLTLSIATSIDALIMGISFGIIHVNLIKAVTIIFIVTFFVTMIGALLGTKTQFISGKQAERFGGIILIVIGIKILSDHFGWFVLN
jgi:manganese efflux pump family protein